MGTLYKSMSLSIGNPFFLRCRFNLSRRRRLSANIFLRMRTGVLGGDGSGGFRLNISYCDVIDGNEEE